MGQSLADAPGTNLSFLDVISGQFATKLAREAEEFGPLLRWQIMRDGGVAREMIFLVGPDANRFVFHTQREAFSHDRGWTPIIGDLMGQGLLNQDGATWARSRKLWNPAFTTAYMETYLPVIQRIVAQHTASWLERREVDLFAEARAITFHVAATALAGVERNAEVERLRELFYVLLPRNPLSGNPDEYADYERLAYAAKQELDALLLDLIQSRRASPAQQAHDVLGLIVHARDEDGVALTDEEVLAHLYILLVAGHETTTILGAWTLYLLATQPAERQRVTAELAESAPDSGQPLSVEAARNLHYLDRFIRETGRLHSPVQNVPRGVVAPVEFAGYTLPVGTSVRLALAATHRLPNIFAEPERFDPDRFAPARAEDRNTPYGLVTFGGGSRLCIGINFANIEVKALAVEVLRSFDLAPLNAELPLEVGFITLSLPQGMPMQVRENVLTRRYELALEFLNVCMLTVLYVHDW